MENKIDLLPALYSKSKHTVIHDSFDEYVFNELKNKSEAIQQIPEKIHFPTINELLMDTFNIFFKYDPKFISDDQIQEDFLVNKEMLLKAMKTEQYSKLRLITKLDEINSAIATATFIETVIQEIRKRDPEIEQKIKQLQQQQNDRLQLMQRLLQMQSALQHTQSQLRQNPSKQLKQHLNQLKNQLKKQQQQLNQLNKQIQQQVGKINNSVKQISVSKAIHKASKETTEINNSIMALGWGSQQSALHKVSAEERIELATALLKNQKLLKLVRELGRMKRLMITTKKTKVKRQTSEICDIETGNKIERLIPDELVKLTVPELKLDFYKRFAERQLLQYSLKDKESKGKGDFIVCMDLSGSMSGQREIWAKAVALACLELAVRQKRGYSLITFSEKVKTVRKYDRRNLPSISDIISIAEENYGGGTNYQHPLTKAMELLQNMKSSDILFITDGECEVTSQFVQDFSNFRRSTKTRVVSVMIGNHTQTLELLSDKVIAIQDLLEGAKDIFQIIT